VRLPAAAAGAPLQRRGGVGRARELVGVVDTLVGAVDVERRRAVRREAAGGAAGLVLDGGVVDDLVYIDSTIFRL
jgi:hypothetical protein